MGAGAFGHITTAMVCAASSFNMQVTDPRSFLDQEDIDFFKAYRGDIGNTPRSLAYVEPGIHSKPSKPKTARKSGSKPTSQPSNIIKPITSKVVVLGDFIDTDALSPGETLTGCTTDEEFGDWVLKYTHPEFREKARNGGQQVVVAGHAMGVGSSRETAVRALKGNRSHLPSICMANAHGIIRCRCESSDSTLVCFHLLAEPTKSRSPRHCDG